MDQNQPASAIHHESPDDEPFPVLRWTLLSTLCVILALGIGEGLRWSGFWHGFESAVFLLVILLIPPLVIFILAWIWNLLCLQLIRPRRHPRLVRVGILSPALGLLVFFIITLPSSPERFEQMTGVAFPEDYSEASFSHFGGGITDHSHTFSFETSREESERLIRELRLEPKDPFSNRDFDRILEKFGGGTTYHRDFEGRNLYCDLVIDESRTKVWILLWGI